MLIYLLTKYLKHTHQFLLVSLYWTLQAPAHTSKHNETISTLLHAVLLGKNYREPWPHAISLHLSTSELGNKVPSPPWLTLFRPPILQHKHFNNTCVEVLWLSWPILISSDSWFYEIIVEEISGPCAFAAKISFSLLSASTQLIKQCFRCVPMFRCHHRGTFCAHDLSVW